MLLQHSVMSDWLFNTQSRVLQADWLILENNAINMPYYPSLSIMHALYTDDDNVVWLQDTNWDDLLHKRVRPPFVPTVVCYYMYINHYVVLTLRNEVVASFYWLQLFPQLNLCQYNLLMWYDCLHVWFVLF